MVELDDFEKQTFCKDRVTKTELIAYGDPEQLTPNEYPPANPGGVNHF